MYFDYSCLSASSRSCSIEVLDSEILSEKELRIPLCCNIKPKSDILLEYTTNERGLVYKGRNKVST